MTAGTDDQLDRTVIVSRTTMGGPGVQDEIGHYLVFMEGNAAGERFEVVAKPLVFGRGDTCDVVVPDNGVSRQHLQCICLNNEVIVSDLQSTNGTLIDGTPIDEPTVIHNGSILQLGGQILKYEKRSRQDVARSQELDRDLAKASNYVLSLLPKPLEDGPVRTDWFYLPSAQLGGDAFGYYRLDDAHYVAYVVDVSGHGVGSAMHSVTILNVLRQRALPHTDFLDPSAVLASLNKMFQMDTHDGQYFTIWYGVYNLNTRELKYAAAGHHAGYLVPPDRSTTKPLETKALMIGALPDYSYASASVAVDPGESLYLFSDGVFEIVTADERQWTLKDFLPVLLESDGSGDEPQRIYQHVRSVARPGQFDDDFSILVVTFV